MKRLFAILTACLAASVTRAEDFKIIAVDAQRISWTNAYQSGVCTLEMAFEPTGPWRPTMNFYTTNASGQAPLAVASPQSFFRLLAVDISKVPEGFSNLVASYGLLRT